MFTKSHRRKERATRLSARRLFFGIALLLPCHAEAQVSQRPARPLRGAYLSTSATMWGLGNWGLCQTCETSASLLPRPALVVQIPAYANNASLTRLPRLLSSVTSRSVSSPCLPI
jgi:hypothetical protein